MAKTQTQPIKAPAGPQPLESPIRELLVEIPFLPSSAYAGTAIRLDLAAPEAAMLRDIQQALTHEAAKLNNGTPVVSPADTVRWIIQTINNAR